MSEALVQAKPEDLRSDRPSLTGNFVIAGEPKVFKTSTGKSKYSFSITTSKWTKEKGYHDPIYFNCYLFCDNDDQLKIVQSELARKNKVHIVNSMPEANRYIAKDGQEKDYGIVFKILGYYPYHLDKNLQRKEFSANSDTIQQATTHVDGASLF